MEIHMDTPVQYLKGVGERRAQQFARLGVTTAGTLLRHYPRQYEDWSAIVPIASAPVGEPCCIRATAMSSPQEHRVRKGLSLYRFTASDGVSILHITLFNNKFAAAKIKKGEEYLFFGTVTGTFRRAEMTSPLIEPAEGGARIRPIYPQTEGLTSRMIETVIANALLALDGELDKDPLPFSLRQAHHLCARRYALENIHFPADHRALSIARRRLVFEELLLLQLGLLRLKGRSRGQTGARIERDYSEIFWPLLPFSPTGAQRRAVADCVRDMKSGYPMSRLIQGDVGSGKTAVAAGVAFTAIRNGFQVAMMAPTEILAEQHARSLASMLEKSGIQVGLLSGSLAAAEKRRILADAAEGRIHFLVGTHALLSEGVSFKQLGLVITDEQHRFGVAQRATLAAKGKNPHLLVMSATPIPRTLALILYGDLDVTILDEMPPGRQPVATYAVGSDKRERAYAYVRKHLDQGRQAYVVCPLVEDGETGLASASAYFEKLASGPLRSYTLGLLHGRMKATEKDTVMRDFAAGKIQVLISTTVIEVGVDVPNAVIMVVENAERFGLAQLHQLRGRVGRGRHASSCILISDAKNEEAVRRLRVMCQTNDGFRIADEDLKLRGPGDFFGSRQHGLPDLKIADLMGDMPLFQEAQEAAAQLVEKDPALELPENRALQAEVARLFQQVGEQGLN